MLHHVVNCCNLKKVSNAYREKFDLEFFVQMTIETINDVLFPPFLFTTLFCLASAFLHEPEAVQSEELTNNRTEVNVATAAAQSDSANSEVNGATIEIEKPARSHHTRHQTTGKKTPKKPAKPIDFAAHSGASTTSLPAVNTSLISLEACSHSLLAPSKLLRQNWGSSKKLTALIPLLNGCRLKSKIGWKILP